MRFLLRSLMGLFLMALTLGILALAGGSTLSSFKERMAREGNRNRGTEQVFGVNVLPAVAQTHVPVISVFGAVRAQRALDIRAPSGGTIIMLSPDFIEGGKVNEAQKLLALDPADAKTALLVAQTDQNERIAELSEAQAALDLAKDEVLAAQAQAGLRDDALKRQKDLRNRGVGTDSAVEAAALAASAADQAVLGKRQAEAQAQSRLNRAVTAKARHEIRLAEVERNLTELDVFAEFSGTLTAVNVVEGGIVGPNEKLARLIDPSALEVAFRLSTGQFARLVSSTGGTPSGPVKVRLDLYGTLVEIDGQIERVSAEVGVGQTGRQVFARLSGAGVAALRPGDFVSVEVLEPPLHEVIRLPSTAVDSASRVLVLGENDRLEIAEVEILRRMSDDVLVRAAGLSGREVVEARSPLLGAGIKVKPVRGDTTVPQGPELIELTAERRAAIVKFISENGNIPDTRKERILKQLEAEKVPAQMVERIESRMGS